MPREDPENADAAVTSEGGVSLSKRRPRRILRYLEDSEELKVRTAGNVGRSKYLHQASCPTSKLPNKQETRTANFFEIFRQGEEEVCIASWARWNAQLKGLVELEKVSECEAGTEFSE